MTKRTLKLKQPLERPNENLTARATAWSHNVARNCRHMEMQQLRQDAWANDAAQEIGGVTVVWLRLLGD